MVSRSKSMKHDAMVGSDGQLLRPVLATANAFWLRLRREQWQYTNPVQHDGWEDMSIDQTLSKDVRMYTIRSHFIGLMFSAYLKAFRNRIFHIAIMQPIGMGTQCLQLCLLNHTSNLTCSVLLSVLSSYWRQACTLFA